MDRIVREVMEPSQPVSTTLTELRDLYLAVVQHEAHLASKAYGPERRALLRGAIQLLDTARPPGSARASAPAPIRCGPSTR